MSHSVPMEKTWTFCHASICFKL